jgi:exopolysaccharide biosynthesis polyprenyl glycosylphosphotransferase
LRRLIAGDVYRFEGAVISVITPFLNPEQQRRPEVDWARLIPGEAPALNGKKPPQSVKVMVPASGSKVSTAVSADAFSNLLTAMLPASLLGRCSWVWLRSVAADFALVGLNWLLIGALLVPLRRAFPQIWVFKFAEGAPVSLLGIATLHAALITSIGRNGGLYVARGDCRAQTASLRKSVAWGTLVLCCAYSMQGAPWPTDALICGAGVLSFAVLLAWRRQRARLWSDRPRDVRNVLMVGAGAVGRRVASYLENHAEAGRAVYGFLDSDKRRGDKVIGGMQDLARLARTGFVDEIILAAPRDREMALRVVREARELKLDVKVIPDLLGCSPAAVEIEQMDGMPVISLHAERLPTAGLNLKRGVDVVGSSLALAGLLPLLMAIGVLIKLDSPGPVLYRAPRAGRKGNLFRCYKFRTMVHNANQMKDSLRRDNQRSGPFFKMAADPRITRLGRVLRRYSLDELPQLWNVLKGDMSLVGPRPHPVDDYVAYDIDHLARLDVMPGITGLWQVTARCDPSFQRGMELDREYIRTWSLALDARILLKTVWAVVRGSGQ